MRVLRFRPRTTVKTGGVSGPTGTDDGGDLYAELEMTRCARDGLEEEIFRLGELIGRVKDRVSEKASAMLRRRLKEYTDEMAALDDEIACWQEIVDKVGDNYPESGA